MNIAIILLHVSALINQSMIIPLIATVLNTSRTQRPEHLRLHVTEKLFVERYEIRSVRCLGLAKLLRAMLLHLAADDGVA